MAKKLNTTETAKAGGRVTAAQLDEEIKKAAKVLKDEKKVDVEIPVFLERRIGKNVPVAINGAVIHVPVGKKVKIPESMAKVLNNSINQIRM